MSDASRTFSALADGNRLAIFESLVSGRAATATLLAGDLNISRQAAAKHLGLLVDAGLASSIRVGRETLYRSEVAPLADVSSWIATVESQWNDRLAALKIHLTN